MGTRIQFHEKLLSHISEIDGRAYFQPPANIRMEYPCIVYELDGEDLLHADDLAYRRQRRYSVTVIDRNPDSAIPDLIGDLFHARMNRHFVSDQLHHFVYSIYY